MHSTGAADDRALYRLSCTSEPARLYSMGPDYAALVTACAAHLSLQPLYLHRAVIKLETQMRALESKADAGLLQPNRKVTMSLVHSCNHKGVLCSSV